MWRQIRTLLTTTRSSAFRRAPEGRRIGFKTTAAGIGALSVALGGALIANDKSANSLGGVTVDSSIDPFPVSFQKTHLGLFSTDYHLVASGVRTVTFLSFKVYGVGLYIPKKDEPVVRSVVEAYLKENPQLSKGALLDDKELSQRIISDISKKVPYAMKITPVRNTDFGHLRDGLTKSILANPLAKVFREEVAQGIQQLRDVFSGHKGSVPKNDSLWVVSDTKTTSIVYEGKKSNKVLGTITEPKIGEVLLVLYLSSAKPLSEPFRKSFISYIV